MDGMTLDGMALDVAMDMLIENVNLVVDVDLFMNVDFADDKRGWIICFECIWLT